MFSLFPTAKSDPALAPFRPGLTFAFFNALAWQIGIGTPMVLFAEQLGATPFQVGLAYSFVFVLTPIQILSTALLPRYGFKALMLGGWRTRGFLPRIFCWGWVLRRGPSRTSIICPKSSARRTGRTLAVSVHGATTAFIGGLSPVGWGMFLKSGEAGRAIDTGVFQWFFVSVVVGAIVVSSFLARLPEEKGEPVDPIVIGNAILRPFRAATHLVNLVEPRSLGRKPPPPGAKE